MMTMAGKSELQLFNQPLKQVVVSNASFVDYLSVTALGDGVTSIDFNIQGSDIDYLDLNDTYLYLKLQVVNDDGSNLDSASKCAPINYMINAIFSDVQLYLNEKLIEGGNHVYAYKSVIESIFQFNEDAKRIQLLTGGFSDDRDEREKWIKGSRMFELVGALRLDFFSQPKYMLPQINMRVQCTLKAARLNVKRAKVDAAVRLGHELGLRTKNAIYPYARSEVVVTTIGPQSHYFTKDNLFGHSQMPKFVVLGLVTNEAFKGSYSKDPYDFATFSVTSLGLYRDGEPVPNRRIYETNFDQGLITESYFRSIILNTQHFNTNLNNGIRMEDWKKDGGLTFYTFNLAPDFEMGNYQQIADGNLRLEIRFKKAIAEAINVVVYALFDDILQITRDRAVIKG